MNNEIKNYLEAAYEKMKQGRFSIKESEEILNEQNVFLKVGLLSSEEHIIWNRRFQSIYTKRIESMALSTRGRNGLLRANIDTCGKLRHKILNGSSADGLMKVRNLGEKTVCEIVVESIQCSLISEAELFQAPWSPAYLRKIQVWLETSGK